MLRRVSVLVCAALGTWGFASAALAAPKLAYETGSAHTSVWLASVSGSDAKKLGPGQNPLIAPSGRAVAATLFFSKGPAIAIYTPGSPTKKYFDNAKAVATPLAWSPDSRYLAVQLSSNQTNGKGSSLAILDTKTGTVKTLATGSTCGASFAPKPPDRLAYASSKSPFDCFLGHVNITTVDADGTASKQITTDGRSAFPLWGPHSIVFDQVTPRGRDNAPAYQLWTMHADGSDRVQITHMKIPNLVDGLTPVGFSANGKRLIADYGGQDTAQTWVVTMATHTAKQLKINGQPVIAGAIARAGGLVVVTSGPIDTGPSGHNIETMSFSGSHATVIVKHADQPSWNR